MLLLFKQLIRFVNGDSFFLLRPRRLPYQIGRLRDHLASRHLQRQGPLKGKGWRSTPSAARRISRSTSCSGATVSDPNKDVILLSIAGVPDAHFAALIASAVDATVVNSPFEYRAERKGFKVLLSIKETAEFVKIPINGLSTSQRKIDREPDEIVRMLRALRNANLFLQIGARSVPG